MQIDKQMIIDLLRSRGSDDKAEQAQGQLPDQVDPEQHAGLLGQLGLDPQELIGLVTGGGGGGGGLGGLAGGLGGLLGGR